MKRTITTLALIASFLFSANAQQTGSDTQLSFAKKNLDKIKNGKNAYSSLIKNADKKLSEELVPVTEKSIYAASGDKHDYVSMGPYWWPDPSKVDGLPYIRKDGRRNPEIEKLDRNKLGNLAKNVTTLAYGYYFSGDEKYAQAAVRNLQMWFVNPKTRMNPNLNYGQMIPGHNNGKGRGEALIDTYSFVEMVDCINILSQSKALKAKDLDAIKQWFSEFVEWMQTSEVGLDERNAKNNHGLAYDVQLTAYSLFVGKKEIAMERINSFAENRLFKQIEPDGCQPLELARTIALHYTLFNIDHAMDMCDLAKSVGIDLYSATSSDGRSISKAIEWVVPYLGKPQSDFPYQQIKEWDDNQEKLCWVLRRSTHFAPNAEYDGLFDTFAKAKSTDMRWLFYSK